jgi:hypothetical protein
MEVEDAARALVHLRVTGGWTSRSEVHQAKVFAMLSAAWPLLVEERLIRQRLGNTADVSKALRRLQKRRLVRRQGAGGRECPFLYGISFEKSLCF